MSLADFQEAMCELFFNEKLRLEWYEKNLEFPGLSPQENSSIKNIPEDRIELIASSTVRGRVYIFFHSIPKSVALYIGEDARNEIALNYAVNYPGEDLHPYSVGIVKWLKFIKKTLLEKGSLPLHLEDILNYEIVSTGLIFYRIPFPVMLSKGPKLMQNIGLIAAGPEFEKVLEEVKSGLFCQEFSDSPKHGYLLKRTAYGINIEKLHWTIYEMLKRCDGIRLWKDIVDELIKEEAYLAEQAETLLAWEKHYINTGVLREGIGI